MSAPVQGPAGPDPPGEVIVVLDCPRDVVNVAGVVRAMKNMGLAQLRLVRPGEFDPRRIEGIAHRSADVVSATEICPSLAEAVADCVHVVGTTARARTAHRNYLRPRAAAERIVARAREGRVAVVFGREDRGLTNEGLDLCDAVVVIPTATDYPSMNLAQACLVVAYEIFLVREGEAPLPRGKRSTAPATREEVEATLAALEGGLARIEFFRAREAGTVMRTFRTLLARAEPDRQEAGLVRAVGYEIGNCLDRLEARAEDGPGDAVQGAAGDRLTGREGP